MINECASYSYIYMISVIVTSFVGPWIALLQLLADFRFATEIARSHITGCNEKRTQNYKISKENRCKIGAVR